MACAQYSISKHQMLYLTVDDIKWFAIDKRFLNTKLYLIWLSLTTKFDYKTLELDTHHQLLLRLEKTLPSCGEETVH